MIQSTTSIKDIVDELQEIEVIIIWSVGLESLDEFDVGVVV
jgi:hypothetical protein